MSIRSNTFARGLRLAGCAIAVLMPMINIAAARAQSEAKPGTDRSSIEDLVKRVNAQEAQLKEVRSKLEAARTEQDATELTAQNTDLPQDGYPRLQFHGFGDVDYRVSDQNGNHNSFLLGQLDAFITSQLSADFGILSETVIEANSENDFGIEIERLQFQWHPNDYFNLDFGRYHTALGYYNTAFHHGTWFQTAVGRPFFLDFEDGGGIIAAHNVGPSIHGAIPSGKWGLGYIFEIGNGRSYVPPGQEENLVLNVKDDNDYKAFNLAFISRPDWLSGLQFGAGIYNDTLTPPTLPRISEIMLHSHLVYKNSNWEFLSEGYLIRHKPRHEDDHWSSAGFIQFARKFQEVTPYARFSYLNASESDAIYQIIQWNGRHYGPGIGVRWDFTNFAAFKLQYDYMQNTGESAVNSLTVQICFTF